MKIQICNSFAKVALVATFLCSMWPEFGLAQDEFVFLLRAKGNPYWNTVAAGIEDTAREKGVKATIYQGQSDSSAEEQLNTCLTSIQRKPKFLAVVAATTSVGIQCLKKAQNAGIGVAELDASIPLTDAEKAGVKLAFSVGSDNLAIGKKAAEYAKSSFSNGAIKILVLEGAVGSEPGRLRVEGFREGINIALPQASVVASISADWDRLKAMSITTDMLERFSKIDLIFAANDLMALGAVEALKTKGKLAETKIVGVDGTPDARRAVEVGELSATVAQVPYLLGKRAVELAVDSAEGRPTPQRETTDTPILTKAVLTDKDSSELRYVR